MINKDKIILYGGSRGGELVLNLASRYKDLAGVIVMVPPHVSLPSKFGWRATSSWTFNNEEIPYVNAAGKSINLIRKGDFYNGFAELLKEEKLINGAEIEVEKINCPVLILSAKNDKVWPSELMAGKIVGRLKEHHFSHPYAHISFDGEHSEPSKHIDTIIGFLNKYSGQK
jgi:pimeloyl-ACP methyl ester carboxylesterase